MARKDHSPHASNDISMKAKDKTVSHKVFIGMGAKPDYVGFVFFPHVVPLPWLDVHPPLFVVGQKCRYYTGSHIVIFKGLPDSMAHLIAKCY